MKKKFLLFETLSVFLRNVSNLGQGSKKVWAQKKKKKGIYDYALYLNWNIRNQSPARFLRNPGVTTQRLTHRL